MQTRTLSSLLVLAVLAAGCGGGADHDMMRRNHMGDAAPASGAIAPAAPAPSGPVDRALADRGKELFQAKACVGCHTIGGGRLTGPDLAGVTERREYGWVIAMITNPDSMVRNDPTARKLFAEYMTPMANMGVTADEARALYEYLRQPVN